MYNIIRMLILLVCIFCNLTDYSFGRVDTHGLEFSEREGDPFFICTANGTYTQYNNGRDFATWTPKPPNEIRIGFAAKATGYGKVQVVFDYDLTGTTGSLNTTPSMVGDYGITSFVVFLDLMQHVL